MRFLDRLADRARHVRLLASIGPGRDPVLGPREVMVDFNNSCNLNCVFCYNYSPLGPPRFSREEARRHFPPDLFRRLLDDCARLGISHISLAGYGEPLLHPHLAELLEEMARRRIRFSICTSGVLLTRFPKAVELMHSAVLSIHAGTPEAWARVHPKSPASHWQSTLDGLRLLQRAGVPTTIEFVLCSENARDLGAAIDLAAAHGADLLVDPVRPFVRQAAGQAEFNAELTSLLQVSRQDLAWLLEQRGAMERHAAARGVRITGLREFLDAGAHWLGGGAEGPVSEALGDFYDRNPCYTGWYFARVLMDGSVSPCCQCVGGIVPGNLNERSFREIWRGPEYRWFRNRALHVPLRDTEIWQRCACKVCDSVTKNGRYHALLTRGGPTAALLSLVRPFLGQKRGGEMRMPEPR